MGFNIFHYFTPKDKKFFPLFEKLSLNLISISTALSALLHSSGGEKRKELVLEIERLEQISDELTRDTLRELGINFITPFDREDIHNLVTHIADAAGFIHNTSKKIAIYKVKKITPEMIKLGDLIQKGAEEIHRAIHELQDVRNHKDMAKSIIKINGLESEADSIFDLALIKLFEEEHDPIQLLKYKDVLTLLEIATDKCEDVANVLETIMIKNA